MKIKLLKSYNVLISTLLGLLGFATACDSGTMDEYGTPSATYKVNGTVRSSETNEPIEHIMVTNGLDTSYTDADGNYQVGFSDFPDEYDVTVKYEDIDSIANGAYTALDTTVAFKDPVFTGGDGGWYKGETSKIVDVKLDSKK
jgi:putative lipoprotein (rSAM/lipoprotein system)